MPTLSLKSDLHVAALALLERSLEASLSRHVFFFWNKWSINYSCSWMLQFISTNERRVISPLSNYLKVVVMEFTTLAFWIQWNIRLQPTGQ